MELQLPKGTRDFPAEEKIPRDELVATLKDIFERFGFNPLETPIFERFDVLSAKYAGGAEILKETFQFQDQGKRALALRYDLTVPFARFVGMNPQLKMPFKRYAIGRVFRDGPLKLGRYREFYQCDADIVGSKSMLADAECLKMAVAGYKALGIPVTIFVNNRKLLEELLRKGGVPEEKLIDAILTLDKLDKIGIEGVEKELKEKKIPKESVIRIIGWNGRVDKRDRLFLEMRDFLVDGSEKVVKDSEGKRITKVKEILADPTEGMKEIEELFGYLKEVDNVIFKPALARGLAYYTSSVFEAFAEESKVTSSIGGGGRYDAMIPALLDSKLPYPAVGFSFGLEPIMDVLRERRSETRRSLVQAYVIPIKNAKECLPIVAQLREANIRTDMDLNGKSISKNLNYANAYAIPFALICGPQELAEGKVKLKDMRSGEESVIDVKEVVARLKN